MSAIKLAEDALNRARGCIWSLLHSTPVRDADETLAEIAAALVALEAVQVEPVAWIVSYDGKLPYSGFSQDRDYVENACKRIGGSARPMALYATPQEAVQTEPVAILSVADVAEIEDALNSTGRHNRLAYALRSRLGTSAKYATPQQAAAPELQDEIKQISDAFGIGVKAQTLNVILANIKNATRRRACLSAIEHEFFTVTVKDDEEDEEPYDECLLNWGEEPAQYVGNFRKALALIQREAAAPEWIPIETAPKDGDCLVWCATDDGGEVLILSRNRKGDWLYEGEPTYAASFYIEPTHWMSIPAAPKATA